uniref:Uncharacterized protein n=1 Tax=Panagrolaimus sp. ES5 TaxID=591445 RepID=A0AC34G9I5_9BILA
MASPYAQFLHDAIYLYGLALSNVFNITGSSSRNVYRNGSFLSDNSDVKFDGLTGDVVVGSDGVRDSIYSFSSYDEKDKLKSYVYLQVVDTSVASPYAQFLHDAIYLYGLALSNVFNITGSSSRNVYRNGSFLSDNSDVKFDGLTGDVVVGSDGVRDSIYSFSSYDEKDKLKSYVYLQVVDTTVNVTPLYSDPTTAIWASRKGIQPLDVPICGFSGKECPMSAFEQYKAYFIVAIVIAVVLVLAIAGIMVYIVHTRLKDIEKQNQLWQVSFNNLVKMNPK